MSRMQRGLGRALLTASIVTVLCANAAGQEKGSQQGVTKRDGGENQDMQFNLWAMGCSHVHTDKRVSGRESLAEAIRHSEQGGEKGGPSFDWDMAVHLGDLCGSQPPPTDEEGPEVVGQLSSGKQHGREAIYNLLGNHDSSGMGEPLQWWFQKWVDPLGKHTEYSNVHAERRPYPVEGTWERYAVRVGNLLFLVMGDRNDGGPPAGRGERGGYPAGAVSGETFEWWKQMVEANQDAVIISAHHHMLKETTVASGPWEGFKKKEDGSWKSHYHGYYPAGGPEGASYLYFVDDKPDAQAFESYLAEHPGAIDLWLGGHTHTTPDDRTGGRSHIETKWGVHFINAAALTLNHVSKTTTPMSRLLTFTQGSDEVCVRCYLHTDQFAPQGWYKPAERQLRLSKPFGRSDHGGTGNTGRDE